MCWDNQALSGEAQVCLCGVGVRWALFSSGLSPLRGSQFCQQEIQTDLNLPHEKKEEKKRSQTASPDEPSQHAAKWSLQRVFHCDY